MKAEALPLLRHERPDVRFVPTTNAEANVAIRAVNARLGFMSAVVYTTYAIPLPR